MQPVYHIPLTDEELKLLGEVCAIQGQIEYLMQMSVCGMLRVGPEVATSILGSSGIGTNSETWIKIVREKCNARNLVPLAEEAAAALSEVARGRNDFVHAVFAIEGLMGDGSGTYLSFNAATAAVPGTRSVAIRLRNKSRRPTSELRTVRDKVAAVSHKFAKIADAVIEKVSGPVRRVGQPKSSPDKS